MYSTHDQLTISEMWGRIGVTAQRRRWHS